MLRCYSRKILVDLQLYSCKVPTLFLQIYNLILKVSTFSPQRGPKPPLYNTALPPHFKIEALYVTPSLHFHVNRDCFHSVVVWSHMFENTKQIFLHFWVKCHHVNGVSDDPVWNSNRGFQKGQKGWSEAFKGTDVSPLPAMWVCTVGSCDWLSAETQWSLTSCSWEFWPMAAGNKDAKPRGFTDVSILTETVSMEMGESGLGVNEASSAGRQNMMSQSCWLSWSWNHW